MNAWWTGAFQFNIPKILNSIGFLPTQSPCHRITSIFYWDNSLGKNILAQERIHHFFAIPSKKHTKGNHNHRLLLKITFESHRWKPKAANTPKTLLRSQVYLRHLEGLFVLIKHKHCVFGIFHMKFMETVYTGFVWSNPHSFLDWRNN